MQNWANQRLKPVSAGVTLAAVIALSSLTFLHMQLFVVADGYLKSVRKREDKSVVLTKPVVATLFFFPGHFQIMTYTLSAKKMAADSHCQVRGHIDELPLRRRKSELTSHLLW